ncbi:metal resistance YCF1 protein [Rutstroemia sp. NJR-2017a BVV2]|nr:metal resistance YCF1 protein [Rutstroemia sp. NJR-2017a BVV2]PQE18496.1 metal resistance YCF1 protein [Rutstroemia sp. NJR-2017a BVV2]
MIWEASRARAPGHGAGGLVDDIVKFSEMESEATPREKASIFSILRFNWVWEFLVYGKSHTLMQKDYPQLVRDARTYVVHQEFETLWYEESSTENPSLSWTLLRLVRKELILSGILSFCARILLKISMPVLLYYFIRFLEDRIADPTLPILPGFLLAGAFALSQMAEVTAWNFGNFIVRDAAIKVQSSLINSIHRSIFNKTRASGEARSSGDVINLISSDIERVDAFIEGGTSGFHEFWLVPGVLAIYLVMLYQLLGLFAFIPIVMFVAMMVLSKLWGRVVSKIQSKANSGRGQRSKLELDVLRSMRTVKMASWETAFKKKLIAGRETTELNFLRLFGRLNAITLGVLEHYTTLVGAVTFGSFAAWSGTTLTPAIIFPAWQILENVEYPIKRFHYWMIAYHNCQEALRSIETKYLNDVNENLIPRKMTLERGMVKIKNGSFAYQAGEDVLKNITFDAESGRSYCLIGRIGMGKSSLCKAILEEMIITQGSVEKYGSVAYAAQKPWIFNGTIKDNIVFGSAWDPDFYRVTIESCALKHDLEALVDGDQSRVGEEGIQLSGGQKARISLARAVYARADIYIIDDVLAAVDQHTARHLNEQVIGPNGILNNRTRILVSNHLPTIRIVDHIVLLHHGIIIESSRSTDVAEGSQINQFIVQAEDAQLQSAEGAERRTALDTTTVSRSHAKAKEMVKREAYDDDQNVRVLGTIAGFARYIKLLGYWRLFIYIIMMTLAFSSCFMVPIYLQYWTEDNVRNDGNKHLNRWFSIGIALYFWGMIILSCQLTIVFVRACAAASQIYKDMISALFRAPMQFFDNISAGQIINRLSGDLYHVDVQLAMSYNFMNAGWVLTIETLLYVAITRPILIIIIIVCIPLAFTITKYYLATSSQVKRYESVTRGALFGKIKESTDGLETIRAYNKSGYFVSIFEKSIDQHMQALYANEMCFQWMNIQIRTVAAVFVFFVPMTIVYSLYRGNHVEPASAAASVGIVTMLMSILRQLVDATSRFATRMIALDRCFEYADLPSEIDNPSASDPGASWPSQGKIEFKNLSICYREDLDLALKGINLKIEPCQKIGVVGRTGAGKSSLIMGLFRIVEAASGSILIDGIDISTVKLETLRKSIAIIPQDAALFKGTLRYNLDLEDKSTDEEIWATLEQCQLTSFVSKSGGLLAEVEEGGKNFSQGERQLISIARTFLNKSRVLILDEATASVDSETDALIQKSIKEISKSRTGKFFGSIMSRSVLTDGQTVITIAHRINTVLDSDRIILLGDGRIVEEGAPAELLATKGAFWELAKEAKVIPA